MEPAEQEKSAQLKEGDNGYRALSLELQHENGTLTAKMEEYQQLQQSQEGALQRERESMESKQAMLEDENRKLNAIIASMNAQKQGHEEEQGRQMSDIEALNAQIADLERQLTLRQSSTGHSSPDTKYRLNSEDHLNGARAVYFNDTVRFNDSDIDSPDLTAAEAVIAATKRVSQSVAELMESTQSARNVDNVREIVFKRYSTQRHIDELTDDDSKSNTFGDAARADGDASDTAHEARTDTESDSREIAEIERRRSERRAVERKRDTVTAMHSQLAHLQVTHDKGTYDAMNEQLQSYRNWISTDELSGHSGPGDAASSSTSGLSASLKGLEMAQSGDEAVSEADAPPTGNPTMRNGHSLITKEIAETLSAEELKRQKLEMQEHLAHLMASHSLQTYGAGNGAQERIQESDESM